MDGAADPGGEVGRYARGHLVSGGVMVGWHEEGDSPVALAASEQCLGEPFGLVRTYAPNWQQPSLRVRDWLAQGKYVLWSVKQPDDAAGHDDPGELDDCERTGDVDFPCAGTPAEFIGVYERSAPSSTTSAPTGCSSSTRPPCPGRWPWPRAATCSARAIP